MPLLDFSFETIVGGVLGKIKLNNPSTNAVPDKVFFLIVLE
jgi:hypothetical protein